MAEQKTGNLLIKQRKNSKKGITDKTEKKQRKLANLKLFKKGQSGNPARKKAGLSR